MLFLLLNFFFLNFSLSKEDAYPPFPMEKYRPFVVLLFPVFFRKTK